MSTSKIIGLAILSFTVGGFVGITQVGRTAKLEGKLEACNQIFGQINQSFPMVGFACITYQGDVYVTTPLNPGVRSSLDGVKEIKE